MKYVPAAGLLLASLASAAVDAAHAQQAPVLPPVTVYGPKPQTGQQAPSGGAPKTAAHKRNRRTAHRPVPPAPSPAQAGAEGTPGVHNAATNPQYKSDTVNLGPLGNRPLLDTPASLTVIPQDLIDNLQTKTVNDTLRFLPSVQIRNQQGFEVSRPQSRGFQGSVVQTTRLDGLSVVGTTAIPAENLSSIQVLNGLAGSLYGPAPPAGVFNYTLKRPTDVAFATYTAEFRFERGGRRAHRRGRAHARRHGRLSLQRGSRPGRELRSGEQRQSHAGERRARFPYRRPHRHRNQFQSLLDQHHGPAGQLRLFQRRKHDTAEGRRPDQGRLWAAGRRHGPHHRYRPRQAQA